MTRQQLASLAAMRSSERLTEPEQLLHAAGVHLLGHYVIAAIFTEACEEGVNVIGQDVEWHDVFPALPLVWHDPRLFSPN